MTIDDYTPVQTTPYSKKHKLKIYLWKFVNKSIYRIIPNQLRFPRVFLLKLFGAKIEGNVFIHRKSTIDHPWNLRMGHLSSIGENAWIYCLDKIDIGSKCTIGKECYLISGSHDVTDICFEQVTKPIVIEDGCWVTTKVTILPGTVLGKFTVVAAGSVVTSNSKSFDIIGGNPAKFIKKRIFKNA